MLAAAAAVMMAGLAGCTSSFTMPQLTGCISDADAQALITRTDAKLGRVVCGGSDWAVATYTYTTSTGKHDEPGEAVLAKVDGQARRAGRGGAGEGRGHLAGAGAGSLGAGDLHAGGQGTARESAQSDQGADEQVLTWDEGGSR